MKTQAEFVVWNHQGVTAVMTWGDYQANKHTFLHNSDGAIYGINYHAGPVPRIATFSDRRDTPEYIYFTGSKGLLEELLRYRSQVNLPLYVPFANRRTLEGVHIFAVEAEKALRVNLDGAIDMFGLRFPEPPAVVDIADCGPDEADEPRSRHLSPMGKEGVDWAFVPERSAK